MPLAGGGVATTDRTDRYDWAPRPGSRREEREPVDQWPDRHRFDPDYLRGLTTNISTHRFVSCAIWMLPIARPKVRPDMPVALDAIAGG